MRLSYSTISQLSYVILGALLATQTAVIGSAMHIAMHAFGKITLFFCAGAVLVATHKTEVSDMRGLGRRMPFTFGAFLIGSLKNYLSKQRDPDNAQALGDEDLARYATEVGLDAEAFKSCVSERRFQAKVDADANDAREAGIRGTPAFVVNGVLISGAQPLDAFVRLIDEELARAGG